MIGWRLFCGMAEKGEEGERKRVEIGRGREVYEYL
jgi:hypothetical protein